MDEDDKVRRNLVVFSAAVVAVAWLELPMQKLISELAKSGGTVSAARSWFAAAVVLAYLLARYHCSDKAAELAQKIAARRDTVEWNDVHPLLCDAVRAAVESERPSDFFGVQLQTFRSEEQLSAADVHDMQLFPNFERGTSMWQGTYDFSASLRGRPLNRRRGAYVVPKESQRTIRRASFLRSWVWSATNVNLVLPYVFGACAAVVIVWKFVGALIA